MFTGIQDRHSIIEGLIIASLSGAFFGYFMERMTRRRQAAWERRIGLLTDGLTPEQRRTAIRSSRRGDPPRDHAIRMAAASIARYRLELMTNQSIKNQVILGAFTLFYVLMALLASPWWWLAFGMFVTFLALGWFQPRMLQRRLALLETSN